MQEIQLFVSALDHFEVAFGHDFCDAGFVDVFHAGVGDVVVVQLADQLLDVVAVKDEVLGEVLDAGVPVSLVDLVENVLDDRVFDHTRNPFDVCNFQHLPSSFHKGRASLECVDASAQITLRDFNKRVENFVRLNFDVFLVADHLQPLFLGIFADR